MISDAYVHSSHFTHPLIGGVGEFQHATRYKQTKNNPIAYV